LDEEGGEGEASEEIAGKTRKEKKKGVRWGAKKRRNGESTLLVILEEI